MWSTSVTEMVSGGERTRIVGSVAILAKLPEFDRTECRLTHDP
ncbi:MAG: hypothetical protein O3C40_36005 [Planctomycetota bacterium]|nr:hypothetical protein [Planctomycetota bacterium]